MADRRDEIEKTLAHIAYAHERDGAGNMQIQHIVKWLRSAEPQDQQIIREVLLRDVFAPLPERIDLVALGALAGEGAASVASQLERIVRSTETQSEWRVEIIEALVCMGHRPALDLCLEVLDRSLQYRCVLLAHLIKLDPEIALERAAAYFAGGLDSSEEMKRSMTANCIVAFVGIYREKAPEYIIELANRTARLSASSGRKLIVAMLEAISFSISLRQGSEDRDLAMLEHHLRSLRHQTDCDKDSPPGTK